VREPTLLANRFAVDKELRITCCGPEVSGCNSREAGVCPVRTRPNEGKVLERKDATRRKMTIRTGIGVLLLTASAAWSQASVDESKETSYIYVDTVHGSDSNPGTQQKPFKTLTKGVATASSQSGKGTGTRVTVLPGTYREAITVGGSSTAPVTIEAATAGTTVISGADVWTGWSVYSGNSSIYTHNWPYKWGYCAQLAGPIEQNIVRRREQIFVSGFHLTQVLSLGEMTVGTFYVNESGSTVYVWPPAGTNMSTATVEVSTRPTLLQLDGLQDWVLRGLTFEDGNGCRQVQPAVVIGESAKDILLDTDKFMWNNAAGLSVGTASYVTVQSSTANHNGESGMLAQQVADSLWNSDEGAYNNWRGAQGAYYAWQAAGGKFFSIHGANFENFSALYNQGKGIHFDTDNMDITVESLLSEHNLRTGAQIEASQGPITFSTADICNNNNQVQPYDAGVNLVDAAYVTVTSSVLANNGTSQIIITGQNGGISVENYQTHASSQVYNQNFTNDSNTIEAYGAQEVFRDSWLSQDWSRFVNSLGSDYNTWWNSSSTAPFTIPTTSTNQTFSNWKSDTGKDSHSSFTAPSASCPSTTPDTPDYWFVVNSGSNSVSPGAKSQYVLSTMSLGFSGEITLKADVSQVPDASASWSASSITSSASSTLTVTTSSATPAGTYPITMIANSGNITHTVTVSLVVN
jgi:Protein of unknown function (DUF1565)